MTHRRTHLWISLIVGLAVWGAYFLHFLQQMRRGETGGLALWFLGALVVIVLAETVATGLIAWLFRRRARVLDEGPTLDAALKASHVALMLLIGLALSAAAALAFASLFGWSLDLSGARLAEFVEPALPLLLLAVQLRQGMGGLLPELCAARRVALEIAHALGIEGGRLRGGVHVGRGRSALGERVVSPQRLVHYRNTWYLDGWCHLREEIRSFALDAINRVESSDQEALDLDEAEIQAVLDSGYGAFTGKTIEHAELEFTAPRAQWVSKETWHPKQESTFTETGAYRLKVPFSNPTELVMDILRHVPFVKVLSPVSVKDRVRKALEDGLENL